MSAIGTNPKSTSRRPVLIRAGLPVEQLQRLSKELETNRIRMVETIFDALCEAGSPNPTDRISAILMAPPPSGLDDPAVVEAFRSTDPDVRMILLLPDEEQDRANSALVAGFNDALTLPASAERLRQALDPVEEAATGGDDLATYRDHDEDQETNATGGTRNSTTYHRSIVEIVLEEACTRIEEEASMELPEPGESLLGDYASQGDIGDTHLIHAVIEGRHIEHIAIELIRNRTGITSLELVMDRITEIPGKETPSGRGRGWTCVQIGEEESFGFLASETADEATLTPWCRWLRHWLVLQHQHADYRRKAWTDELTGAGNRRALNKVLGKVIDRARSERRAVTVMFFDIDNFKTYNDQFGHDAGDKVLRETVQLLRSVIRRGDHVFRVGGDEFVVIFAPDPAGPRSACSSPPESIEQIASRFQHQVGSLQLPQIGLNAPGTLSISAGMVSYPWDGQDPEELLRKADQLALESKRSGKNVITFGPAARNQSDEFPPPPEDERDRTESE